MSARYYAVPLWRLLQLIASCYDTFIWLFLLLRTTLRRSYDYWLRSSAEKEQREQQLLESCQAQLSKKPRHLALLIGTNAKLVDEALIARICSFALKMDIEQVSVYDTRPLESGRLDLAKLQTPKGVMSEALKQRRYRWSTENPLKINGFVLNGKSNSHCNGNSAKSNGTCLPHSQLAAKTLEIYEISEHDNLPLMAQICQQLFKQRHSVEIQQLLKDRTQLMQRIDAELAQELYAGAQIEPELGLVFNADLCIYDMLPWHLRFTEFHAFPSGADFDATAFADVLYRYSRCEQRWGK